MYLFVMFSLNNFTKQTMQCDVQCISCSLSFSFRGYDRSHSISCTLSFLTSRENNKNGTIINNKHKSEMKPSTLSPSLCQCVL